MLGQPSSLNATNWAVKQTLRESNRAVDAARAAFGLVSRCPKLSTDGCLGAAQDPFGSEFCLIRLLSQLSWSP